MPADAYLTKSWEDINAYAVQALDALVPHHAPVEALREAKVCCLVGYIQMQCNKQIIRSLFMQLQPIQGILLTAQHDTGLLAGVLHKGMCF